MKNKVDIERIKEEVKQLRNDTVTVKPVNIDWAQRIDENGEGYKSWSCEECPECEEEVLTDACHTEHKYLDMNTDCEGYIAADGPMMNYYYPLPDDMDCEDARKLSGPIVLIEFDDGNWALALSGGGMDLSWDICRAFIDLGYLPPIEFRLPEFAGDEWTYDRARIVMAMLRSLECAHNWIKSSVRHLVHLEEYLKKGDT